MFKKLLKHVDFLMQRLERPDIKCLRLCIVIFNSIGVLNFYITNFILCVLSNVLATRKWHCLVLAIYSTQLFLFVSVFLLCHRVSLS